MWRQGVGCTSSTATDTVGVTLGPCSFYRKWVPRNQFREQRGTPCAELMAPQDTVGPGQTPTAG